MRWSSSAVVAIAIALGCASPPAQSHGPTRALLDDRSDRYPDEVVERALAELPDPLNTGVLYPPTEDRPEGTYGLLEPYPSVVRRGDGEWLVAFAFSCPADPTRGRVVRVYDSGDARLVYPPVVLPSLEPASLDDAALAERGVVPVDVPERAEAVGLWYAPFDESGVRGAGPFVYDGRSVRLHLWPWRWLHFRAEDEIYRVEASWSGDVLRIRYPYGAVEDFVRFRGGRFESLPTEDHPAVAMQRAADASAIADCCDGAELLRPRPVHDYERGRMAYRCAD